LKTNQIGWLFSEMQYISAKNGWPTTWNTALISTAMMNFG
jgi:hypothetical protein